MLALPWLAHHLLPMRLPFPAPLRTWVAGVLAIVGIGAWIVCLDTFSRRGRGTPLPADAPRQLVTQGLFSRIRNPIMAAELAVIWGEALYLTSVGAIAYATLMTIGAHLLVVYVEEPELRRRFGQSYAEYCQKVPRWLPRLGRRS